MIVFKNADPEIAQPNMFNESTVCFIEVKTQIFIIDKSGALEKISDTHGPLENTDLGRGIWAIPVSILKWNS